MIDTRSPLVGTFPRPNLGDDRIAPIAALLAQPARVAMLWAVSDGRALPAGELAFAAGIGATAASAHLALLTSAGLLNCERHGRHRYYRLGNPNIVAAMEALAVATPHSVRPARKGSGPTTALRTARTCYDHLAGALGVGLTNALVRLSALRVESDAFLVNPAAEAFVILGIDATSLVVAAEEGRRPIARRCLDWSERQYHVAGLLGSVLSRRLVELNWVSATKGSRALTVTSVGRRAMQHELGFRIF